MGRGEAEIAQQHRVHGPQYPEHNIGYADIFHQVRNTEIGVLIAEPVDKIAWIFHCSLLNTAHYEINIPLILRKVYENFVKPKIYALSFHNCMLLW